MNGVAISNGRDDGDDCDDDSSEKKSCASSTDIEQVLENTKEYFPSYYLRLFCFLLVISISYLVQYKFKSVIICS
jgi:hypothetical protein